MQRVFGGAVGAAAAFGIASACGLALAGCASSTPPSGFAVVTDAGSADATALGTHVPESGTPSLLGDGGGLVPVGQQGEAFSPNPVGAGQITDPQAAELAMGFSGAPPGSAPPPCLIEPTIGALFPTNFTPPLFEWTADPSLNVFELRLHVDGEKNDLVVYTDQTNFHLSPLSWDALGRVHAGADITISLRAGTLSGGRLGGGVSAGTSGAIHIAPVAAPGTVVYWTTSGMSALKGFRVGDTTARTVLTPALVEQTSPGESTTCIGCHVSSPDGNAVFVDRQQAASGAFGIDARLVDGTGKQVSSDMVSQPALATLSLMYDIFPTLSPAHYSPTDAVAVSVRNVDVDGGMYDDAGSYSLVWTDLHTGASGGMLRNGDPGQPDSPSFSHDGTTVAYTSTTGGPIGIYEASATTDIFTVPYADHTGGTASPLPGASDPMYNEYYPAYSPADRFVAFNRTPAGKATYAQPDAEVFVVPAKGGAPVRLAANDPPACAGTKSPGLTNSWPRWAPSAGQAGSKRFYWLIFSSTRRSGSMATKPIAQLFLTALVTAVNGTSEVIESTYPAVYIPAQSALDSNHTPAWDEFKIPLPQ